MRILMVSAIGLTGIVLAGCGSWRTLTIVQGDRINNAMHSGRPADQRSGDPLEVAIVCVNPQDLEHHENAGLKPRSGMTCKAWYDNRPVRGGGDPGRFKLPPEQIFLLTDAKQYYGTKKGPAPRGAINDGRKEISVAGIRFRSTILHKRDSVIYVFPKFVGPKGEVLPVPAVEFSPPSAYPRRLEVEIGVDESRPHYHGQYIDNTTERAFWGLGSRKRG